MTPLEKFEIEKNEFLKHGNLETLAQCFRDYAKAINTEETDKQEDYIPLAQLPPEEYAAECLREEECLQQRMLAVLADPHSIASPQMLIIRENCSQMPIVDYYQILILWRERQYENVRILSKRVLERLIKEPEWLSKKHCSLIPYYYKFSNEVVEKYLHPMMTDLSPSEIYYYYAKSKQILNNDPNLRMADCYYFRARDCISCNLLQEADFYIDKAITIKNCEPHQNLKSFLKSLMSDPHSAASQMANAEQAQCFLKKNTLFCYHYANFLAENGKSRPGFLVKFTAEHDKKSVKRIKLSSNT